MLNTTGVETNRTKLFIEQINCLHKVFVRF